MITVRIDNLVKRFAETTVLDRISLRVDPGEIFFLLGPSGCGKTTLLRSIAGFYFPDEGTIHFDNEDVTRVPPHRRKTGMMFQNYALWPHMTVAKNVAFGLEERKIPRAETRQRVEQALSSVRMEKYADRHIHQLSGGQQQRVALARALVVRPRCLLLDEPLSNLDAKLRLQMRTEIRRICRDSGLTAIYVTHDQKEALSIADRIAILERGGIQQVGSPLEVYRRPHNRFVADFIGETNILEGTVESAEGQRVFVNTAIGAFVGGRCRDDMEIFDGKQVCVSIRPEGFRLQTTPGSVNSVRGRITDAVYLGEIAQYLFECRGKQIRTFEMNPRFVNVAHDRELFAVADCEDTVILPAN
jgi:iron(III) transport system ATP-binding protein